MRRIAGRGADASHASRSSVIRSRVFRKYAALFAGVVSAALLTEGIFEIWFSYQEHKALLIRSQRDQAVAAAEKIEQFVDEIRTELGWTALVPWSAEAFDQQYFDAVRLLRQVPAITEFMQIDASGHEQLRVSRLVMDVIGSGLDLSREPKFIEAKARKVYYGPVYFRRESEPYMTIALSGALRESGVSVAEVNLKFIWDIVSKIRVGERGYAYVVDAQGGLIAHPEINLVLRHTNLSQLPQIQAAQAGEPGSPGTKARTAKDVQGHDVMTAFAPIAPLGWFLFVELPVDEAYAPLYASILRSGTLLLAGLVFAVFAGLLLARRMVVPIRAMRERAALIGGGDLGQRIAIKTGDELEELGDQFNRMAAQLENSYATLERKVEERTRQLELANVAKSRFIAAASHDLRQPLHALGLFVAQLRSNMDSPDRYRIVERADAAVGEMNDLFDALLDISKLDAGVLIPRLAEFPIGQLLRRMTTTFAGAAAAKGLSLRVVVGNAWVRSDAILLERVLLNLVSNAVRYTSRGGIVVGCRRRKERLRIEVWDSGSGIPEDQRKSIFDEFYQLADPNRPQHAGLGLGLAIVDRFCQLLDHPLELTSRVGKGSRFTVIVPMVPARTERFLPASSPEIVVDVACGKHVAVIDDDLLVLDGMGGILRSWGCQVVTGGSCQAVLAEIGKRDRPPDLIISDYHLSNGETGIAAVERLRATYAAAIPAFLISGDTSPERLRHAHAQGYQLLHKPVSPMALRAILNRLLTDRRDVPEDSGARDFTGTMTS